ncbi:MAG: type II toxin-antitoxin system ParD family antitoxin [Alphaproteobacteria bacterium]
MATVKKSISVTDQQAEWIKVQIANGHYNNESEIIRAAIREKQERESGIEAIRAAIIAGEESGISDRTPREIVEAAKKRLRADGKL